MRRAAAFAGHVAIGRSAVADPPAQRAETAAETAGTGAAEEGAAAAAAGARSGTGPGVLRRHGKPRRALCVRVGHVSTLSRGYGPRRGSTPPAGNRVAPGKRYPIINFYHSHVA